MLLDPLSLRLGRVPPLVRKHRVRNAQPSSHLAEVVLCIVLSCPGAEQAAAVWSFGQLGKHDAPHAAVLAENDVLRLVLETLIHEESSDGVCGFADMCAMGSAFVSDVRHGC